MFGDLKSIVDLIRSGISDFGKTQSKTKRKKAVLALLHLYFMLKDCVDEGERLVDEAGPEPLNTVAAMDEWTAATTLERWDAILERQGWRLRASQGSIMGLYELAVINPELQEKINRVIGSKFERVSSLHAIGATLFFRAILPTQRSNDERARLILTMSGSENDLLDMVKVNREISDMREGLNRFREVVETLLTKEEISEFSRQARLETLLKQ